MGGAIDAAGSNTCEAYTNHVHRKKIIKCGSILSQGVLRDELLVELRMRRALEVHRIATSKYIYIYIAFEVQNTRL